MIELALALLLTAIATAERIVSGRRTATERQHLLAIITAAQVSPVAAAAAARSSKPAEPKSEERRPTPIDM